MKLQASLLLVVFCGAVFASSINDDQESTAETWESTPFVETTVEYETTTGASAELSSRECLEKDNKYLYLSSKLVPSSLVCVETCATSRNGYCQNGKCICSN